MILSSVVFLGLAAGAVVAEPDYPTIYSLAIDKYKDTAGNWRFDGSFEISRNVSNVSQAGNPALFFKQRDPHDPNGWGSSLNTTFRTNGTDVITFDTYKDADSSSHGYFRVAVDGRSGNRSQLSGLIVKGDQGAGPSPGGVVPITLDTSPTLWASTSSAFENIPRTGRFFFNAEVGLPKPARASTREYPQIYTSAGTALPALSPARSWKHWPTVGNSRVATVTKILGREYEYDLGNTYNPHDGYICIVYQNTREPKNTRVTGIRYEYSFFMRLFS